jgi:thymidine phosphorylase
MSKKLAEGLDALVLDVKFGSGAFMTEIDRARELAETMVGIGKSHGVDTVALLTDMNTPLGRQVGNANEIVESIEVLKGEGPNDLTEVTIELGVQMLLQTGVAPDADTARERLNRCVADGSALEKFMEVVEAQGGDPAAIENPELLPSTGKHWTIEAKETGFVSVCDAKSVGVAGMRLGAGRARKEDTIDPAVGITVLAKPGDEVEVGTPLAVLEYRHQARLDEALRILETTWTISEEPPEPTPLILELIE